MRTGFPAARLAIMPLQNLTFVIGAVVVRVIGGLFFELSLTLLTVRDGEAPVHSGRHLLNRANGAASCSGATWGTVERGPMRI
jgi:hypothetical protein